MSRVETYIRQARQRAKRRKSPWNLLLIPLVILGVGSTWFLLTKVFLSIQHGLIPPGAILASYTRVGSILMFVPTLFPSLAIGMMMANLLAWCIRSARVTLEREAKGVKYASFRESIKHLAIASVILLLVATPISFLGAINYFYVTIDGVHLNQLFSTKEKLYTWADIREVKTRCLVERNNLHLNYILCMNDGTKVDLLNEPRMRFVEVYDQIRPLIKAQSGIVYKSEIRNSDINRLRKRYHSQDAERILEVICDKL